SLQSVVPFPLHLNVWLQCPPQSGAILLTDNYSTEEEYHQRDSSKQWKQSLSFLLSIRKQFCIWEQLWFKRRTHFSYETEFVYQREDQNRFKQDIIRLNIYRVIQQNTIHTCALVSNRETSSTE